MTDHTITVDKSGLACMFDKSSDFVCSDIQVVDIVDKTGDLLVDKS